MELYRKINLTLLYSLPIFFIFSHSIADIIISFIGVNFFIIFITKRNEINLAEVFTDKVLIFFILFYLVLISSSYLAEFQSISLKRSLPYIRFIFFVAAIKYWLLIDNKKIKILIYCIVLSLLFVCVDLIYQYFNYEIVTNGSRNVRVGVNLFGYQSNLVSERFQGPFRDEFIAGGFVLKFSPFLWLLCFQYHKLKKTNLSLFLIFISILMIFFVIYITGDRSPFFQLLCISLISTLYLDKKKILIFFSSIFLIVYLFALNTDKKQRYYYETLNAVGIQKDGLTLDTGYGHLFYAAYKIWINNPLLGVGTKNYRKICHIDEYNFESKNNIQLCSTHPHNYLLELLAETGLIGLIAFYGLIILVFRNFKIIIKKNLHNLELKFIYLSLGFILWPLTTTGSIMTNKNSIILWFVFAIIFAYQKINKIS